jgi:hypothetical protein
MKITQKQLNELLRLITRKVLKEYSSLGSSLAGNDTNSSSDPGSANNGQKPNDAQTAYEKSKAKRDAAKQQQDSIRTATMDLKGVKTQQDYFTQQAKMNKLDITAKEKQLQQLKGATTSGTTPAGGVIP